VPDRRLYRWQTLRAPSEDVVRGAMTKKLGRAGPASGVSATRTARRENPADRGRQEPQPASLPTGAGRWTFLTNHCHVMVVLSENPDIVLREVAVRVGITERAVQRIIADLEEAGFIEIQKVGRRNRYRIRSSQPLRHPIEAHHTIGDLIALILKE